MGTVEVAGRPEGSLAVATQPVKWGWIATLVAVAAALVSIGSALYTVHADRREDAQAKAGTLRAARHDVIANVLEMGRYDAEGGGRNQNEIVLLVGDVQKLVDEFGREELELSPVVYRLMAEYVAYSTRRVDLAQELADEVLDTADPEADSVELVLAHRVLGDVGAQTRQPGVLQREYDLAIKANAAYRASEPRRGQDVDNFTLAFQLLSAYLGASLNDVGTSVHDEFCKLTRLWESDWERLELVAERGRVVSQLRRLGVDAGHLDRLRVLCA